MVCAPLAPVYHLLQHLPVYTDHPECVKPVQDLSTFAVTVAYYYYSIISFMQPPAVCVGGG
jgi:hypothetical protein